MQEPHIAAHEPTGCPHCGSTKVLELVRDEINGRVCEADNFCGDCKRHLEFFSYGAYLPGTGTVMTEAEAQKMARAARNLGHIQRQQVA